PRNVMLRTDAVSATDQLASGDFDLCLVDFGSASLLANGVDPTFTQISDVWRMGTPSYAPPEMLSSDVVLPEEYRHSQKIDVYALCSILYELYCGHVPFEVAGRAGGRTPYRIKTEERPEELTPRDPDAGALAASIMAGLEARQEARPSAARLQAALDNWQRLPSGKPATSRVGRSSHDAGFWQPNYAERTITRRKLFSVGLVAASAVACGLLVGGKLMGGRETPLDKSRYAMAAAIYDGEPLFKAYDADSRAWVLCSAAGEIVASFSGSRACGALREGLVALFDDVSQRYGYVTPTPGSGEGYAWVVLPALSQAADFSGGLAAARDPKSGLWGYVDTNGEWAIEPRYAEAASFSQGAAAVRSNDASLRWGAVDATGEWLVEPQFLSLGSRDEDGFAVAEDAGQPGSWGIVDADGEWTSDRRFYRLRRLGEGLAPALEKSGASWGFVDAHGEWVVDPAFADARPFYEGQAAVQDSHTRLWSFVGMDGKPAHGMRPSFWKLGDLHDGLAPAQASAADDKVVFDESDPNTFVRGAGMRYGYVDASGTWQMRRLTRLVDAAINPPQL
ncbi:MAG: WG repeat-containing protein, partial [Atopobiaceae bacterium]|nr:WG repeat-containing protein [Atopobiaceae bacterium]